MADEKKKTKIDLKARLGKTTQVGLGGGMPAPAPLSGPGGMPPPPPSSDPGGAASVPQPLPTTTPAVGSVRPPPNIAPPAGISPGIPLPPFAPQPRQQQRAEPKPSAAQQTIKVEMGEEVALEHKKMQTRAIVYAAIAALVGAGLGFVAGGSKEQGDRARKAARGAGLLVNDVKAANEKIGDMEKALGEAEESLKGSNTIPDGLAEKLAVPIPFDSTKLDGRDTGSLPITTFRLLSDYTRSVEAAEKLRETLKNTAGLAKDALAKAKAETTAPTVGFSVLFRNEGGKGMVAEFVTVKEPFPWKGDFKKEYTVVAGGRDRNASRWEKGDLGGNVLPVDPGSVPPAIRPFVSDANVQIFREALRKLTRELKGDASNPTNEIPGLLKTGDDLVHKLTDASRNQ